jgi:hypothetical protein
MAAGGKENLTQRRKAAKKCQRNEVHSAMSAQRDPPARSDSFVNLVHFVVNPIVSTTMSLVVSNMEPAIFRVVRSANPSTQNRLPDLTCWTDS